MTSWKEFRSTHMAQRPDGTKITEHMKEIGRLWREHKTSAPTQRMVASRRSTTTTTSKKSNVNVLKMDVPLFIRMLEFSREQAKTDMDLHRITENALSLGDKVLRMSDYKNIVRQSGGSIFPL